MISVAVLSIILSIVAIAFSVGAMAMVIDVRARTSHEPTRQSGMEGQAKEISSRVSSTDSPRITEFALPSEQSISSRFRSVPQTPPTAIAPGIKNPPRVKGGFGSQATSEQTATDGETSKEEQTENSSSSESGIS